MGTTLRTKQRHYNSTLETDISEGIINKENSFNNVKKLLPSDMKEYFALINNNVKLNSLENLNSKLNISISLDKKDFSKQFNVKKYSLVEEKEYIPWKTYLINYLTKQNKMGIDWASDILE